MTGEEHTSRSAYREGKHQLYSIRWMLFFVVIVQTAVTVAAKIAASFLPEPPPVYLQMLVIELFAYLLPLSLYARENRVLTVRDAQQKLGLKSFRPALLPLILLAGIGCQFFMIILDLPISLLRGQSDGYIPKTPAELTAAIIVIAVIPAVFEEFLLRGIVYGVMAELNTKAAWIFSTVMFALMHGSIPGLLGYLFLGAVLVIVLQRTGSLYACMIFHMVNNITALLLSYFSSGLFETPAATIWIFVAGILIFILGVMGLLLATRRPAQIRQIKTVDFLGQSFINLPVLLCLAGIIAVWYFS